MENGVLFSLKQIADAIGCSTYLAKQWLTVKGAPVRVRAYRRAGTTYRRYSGDPDKIKAWLKCC